MKKIGIILALTLAGISFVAQAKTGTDPQGYVTYSLPSTTITLEVEAVQETFYAGPYAKYAEKYLGIKPRMKDETSVQLTQLRMVPFVEADQNCRYSVKSLKNGLNSSVFRLSSAGLVTFVDAKFADESVWRFPVEVKEKFAGKGVSSNITSESTTLYRNDKKESMYNRVSVQQNMVVEKTLEQKAAETAKTILDLRRQRLQIVTGDTDATYNGEAMGAAIGELTRLEKEYLTLFIGYSEYQNQVMRFDVVPEAGRESHMYIAFRVSDANGLVPADDLTGKPVVMEIIPQTFEQPEVEVKKEAGSELEKKKTVKKGKKAKKEKKVKKEKAKKGETEPKARKEKKVKGEFIHYRIPAICTVKLKNGADLLLQSRVPVYQLGQDSSIPAKMILK